jgi:hypothetical protein
MEAHRKGWAKMPVPIAGAPLAWRVRGSASFGKIFETLRTLETRHRMPLSVDHCQGVGITEHEASVVEHDGPPPGLSAVVAVDDYLHAGQVAEVLDDDARLGR